MTDEKNTNFLKDFVDRWPTSALYISVMVTIILCVEVAALAWNLFGFV